MLSRIRSLPKFSGFARHLSNSNQLRTEESKAFKSERTNQSSAKPVQSQENKNIKTTTFKPPNSHLTADINKQATSANKFYQNSNSLKPITKLSLTSQGAYNALVEKLKKNLNSPEELIKTCQELDKLVKTDNLINKHFAQEEINAKISNNFFTILATKDFNNDTFLTIAKYIGRFDIKQFSKVEAYLEQIIPNLNGEQLLDVIELLGIVKRRLDIDILNLIHAKINDLKSFDHLIQAFTIFSADNYVLTFLGDKILQISETLTVENWIALLNTCSIIKYRNLKIIEACAYNISGKNIDTHSIYKILLSCGILNYKHNSQFLKFLIQRFNELLGESKSNKVWFQDNKIELFSIISSIGMLQLREKVCLNNLSELLNVNCEDPRVIINFIITCGSLNYDPNGYEKLIAKIKLTDFNKEMDTREKMFLLNYVWSLCMLKQPNKQFISAVLNQNFCNDLVEDTAISIYLKPVLMKLLNVNLYTQLFVDDYNGDLLPEKMDANTYAYILKPETTHMSNSLISTLTSYKSPEKYFKTNMLTPFGIVIDALMVIDDKGNPCVLTEYFNEAGQLETKNDSEKKLAIKVVDSKDRITLFGNKLNGNISMQILLLKELGYTVVTVTEVELLSLNIMKRVDLIKSKLIKAASSDD